MASLTSFWLKDLPAKSLKEALEAGRPQSRQESAVDLASDTNAWPDLHAATQSHQRSSTGNNGQDFGNANHSHSPHRDLPQQKGPRKRAPTNTFSVAEAVNPRRPTGNAARQHQAQQRNAPMSSRQLRKVQGLVKAYPTADKLAEAIKKRVQNNKPKNLSSLKRLILREKAAKAQQAAQGELKLAVERLNAAQTAKASLQATLKDAEMQDERDGSQTNSILQTQILEMAMAEADRRIVAAQEVLQTAEAKAEQANIDQAKILKPRASTKPKILKSELMRLQNAHHGTIAETQIPKPSFREERAQSPTPIPERAEEDVNIAESAAVSDDESLEGLEGFENTLASWMYEASKKNPQPAMEDSYSRPSSRASASKDETPAATSTLIQEHESISSEAGSSGPSLDGWEDVLEAWAVQADTSPSLPSKERQRKEFMRTSSATVRDWPSRPRSQASEQLQLSPLRQMSVQSQNSVASSLNIAGPPTTQALLGLGFSADMAVQSSASMMELFHQMSLSQGESQQPRPLLADILSGSNVSTDAMLDLRARMPTSSMPTQPSNGDDSSYPSARTGGGGASHPSLPSRLSEIYPQLAHPDCNLPSDPNDLAMLLKALEGNSFAQQPVHPSAMPSLGNLDHLNLGSRLLTDAELQEVLNAIQSGTQPSFAANIDLFAQASEFNALADLGLPKLQGDASNIFGERLSYNVLNATQQKLLDNLSPPKEWLNGPPHSQPLGTAQMPHEKQTGKPPGTVPAVKKQEQRPREAYEMPRSSIPNFHGNFQGAQPWWNPQQSPRPGNNFGFSPPAFFSGPMGAMQPGFHYGPQGMNPFFNQNAGAMNIPWTHGGNGMMSPMQTPAMPNMRHTGPSQPHSSFHDSQSPHHGHLNGQNTPSASNDVQHDRICEICDVVCSGESNFQQHLSSKRHLRRTAQAGVQALDANTYNSAEEEKQQSSVEAANPTYMGLGAQCRTYCKQVISADLNKVVAEFLQQLLYWQERTKAMNPMKAKNKRLVSGLREVSKAVKLKKAKTIIVAPNIEQIESEGGLDDLLTEIMKQAEIAEIPIVFALSRKKLGQVFGCRKKMSAIAILEYSGAEQLFKTMSQQAQAGREEWHAHHILEREGKAVQEQDADQQDLGAQGL